MPVDENTPFDPNMPDEPVVPVVPDEVIDPITNAGIDPTQIITIISNGRPAYVETAEPITFGDAMTRAGLTYNGNLDVYMNGQKIALDTPIPGGATVTVVGNVKGGSR